MAARKSGNGTAAKHADVELQFSKEKTKPMGDDGAQQTYYRAILHGPGSLRKELGTVTRGKQEHEQLGEIECWTYQPSEDAGTTAWKLDLFSRMTLSQVREKIATRLFHFIMNTEVF
jgi:hypothetical protein